MAAARVSYSFGDDEIVDIVEPVVGATAVAATTPTALSTDHMTWPSNTPPPSTTIASPGAAPTESLAVSDATMGGEGGEYSAAALWGSAADVATAAAIIRSAADDVRAALPPTLAAVADMVAFASASGAVVNCPRAAATLAFVGVDAPGAVTVCDSPYQAPRDVRVAVGPLAVAAAAGALVPQALPGSTTDSCLTGPPHGAADADHGDPAYDVSDVRDIVVAALSLPRDAVAAAAAAAAAPQVTSLRLAREVAWTGATQTDGGSIPTAWAAPLPPPGTVGTRVHASGAAAGMSFNPAGGVVVDGVPLPIAAKQRMAVDDVTRWPATAHWGDTRSLTPAELSAIAAALPQTQLRALDISGNVIAPFPYAAPVAVATRPHDDPRSHHYVASVRDTAPAAPRAAPMVDPALTQTEATQALEVAAAHPLAADVHPYDDAHVDLYSARRAARSEVIVDELGTAANDGHADASPAGLALQHLFEAIVATPTLAAVDMTGMDIGSAPLRNLMAVLPAAPHVRSLTVAGCAANHRLGAAAEQYLPHSQLVDFNIAANPTLGDDGAAGVVRGALACPTLRALSVAHCGATDATLALVGEQLQTCVAPIEHLNIANNPFRGGGMGDGAASLASGIAACDTMKSLSLAGSGLLGPYAHHVFAALRVSTIEALNVAGCGALDAPALAALAAGLQESRVKSLDISNLAAQFAAGADVLSAAVADPNQSGLAVATALPDAIEHIVAAGAGVGDLFLVTLAMRLRALRALRDVDISGNIFTEGALHAFARAVRDAAVYSQDDHGAYCAAPIGRLNLSAVMAPFEGAGPSSGAATAAAVHSPLSRRVVQRIAELVADPASSLHTLCIQAHDPHPLVFEPLFDALATRTCRLRVLSIGPVDASGLAPGLAGDTSWRGGFYMQLLRSLPTMSSVEAVDLSSPQSCWWFRCVWHFCVAARCW